MKRSPRTRLVPLPGDEVIPVTPRGATSLAERLWPKVAGPWYSTPECPIRDTDCWLWFGAARTGAYRTGADGKRGQVCSDEWNYGRIHAPLPGQPRRLIGAHRAAYEVVFGPVPEGLLIRHLCHQHWCCNPWHLKPGTAADNAADIRKAGRATGYRAHRRHQEVGNAA